VRHLQQLQLKWQRLWATRYEVTALQQLQLFLLLTFAHNNLDIAISEPRLRGLGLGLTVLTAYGFIYLWQQIPRYVVTETDAP
jgi:hypothetical protein